MKSIFETLAALGTGAILLTGTGCGGAPAKAKEVPAAESKPEAKVEAPVESKSDAATAGATDAAKPEAAPATPEPAAAPAPVKKTNTAKKPGAKKGGADAKCGEGTCG